MAFRRKVTITLYARQQKRCRCIEQSLDSMGEGEGGMIGENSIETCVLSYVKTRLPVQVQCMRQGAQGWCTGMTLRDRTRREVGGGVQDGEHMYTCGRFMSTYPTTHYNIVK